MAEHFWGRDYPGDPTQVVHFTNGGGESLFGAWFEYAGRLPESPARAVLLPFLEERYRFFGSGCRAFFLHDLPDELRAPRVMEALLQANGLFLQALATEDASLQTLAVSWDRERRLSWLVRVRQLDELLRQVIPPEEAPPSPALALREDDRIDYEIEARLQRVGLLARAKANPRLQLALRQEMIALAQNDHPARRSKLLHEQFYQCGLLLGDLGEAGAAIAAHQQALAHATSPEDRAFLEEYLALLCSP